jgi:Kef-type K+ transport system membrane component KefB
VSLQSVALIVLKGFGFFAGLLAAGLLIQKQILWLVSKIGDESAQAAFALAIGLLAAGLAEYFGLAMVIGAYVMGLALPETRGRQKDLREALHGEGALVPVFFCVTGMMVDIRELGSVVVFSLVLTGMCGAGKFLGCFIPSAASGLSLRQSTAVGIGMLPRLEVGLVAASVSLLNGLITPGDMAAAMVMIVITAVVTPLCSHGWPGAAVSTVEKVVRTETGVGGQVHSQLSEPGLIPRSRNVGDVGLGAPKPGKDPRASRWRGCDGADSQAISTSSRVRQPASPPRDSFRRLMESMVFRCQQVYLSESRPAS